MYVLYLIGDTTNSVRPVRAKGELFKIENNNFQKKIEKKIEKNFKTFGQGIFFSLKNQSGSVRRVLWASVELQ